MPFNIRFECRHFNELNTRELYAILQVRLEVFSLEQQCMYMDCDDRDLQSWHVMGWQNERLVAYSRLLPRGLAYDAYCSIGRVLNRKEIRRQGIGKDLVSFSIEKCHELFPGEPIKIGAQAYLESFYASFGFVSTTHRYLEDDIPHLSMILL